MTEPEWPRVQARDEPCADPSTCDVHGSVPVMDRVRRGRGGRGGDLPPGKFERAAGDMHEPKPYTGALDWSHDGTELVHPFID
jgi:hypothetical protein